ncbi:MAG TPA: carboxypeptidase regulatory-like domain-containing protein [Pyrinomonadaceae bacterium]|jgi:hypothetical protein
MRRQIFSTANLYIVAAAMILSFSFSSFAQEITGTLVGNVRDASGSVVPGATVTISDQAKNTVIRTLTTDDEGTFSAPNLNSSVYTVTVEAANFKKTIQTDVKLDVGARRTVDFSLEAGKIEEVVTVEAEAVSVDLTSPTSGTVINGDQVRELSINNRNFTQLVALAPGVSSDLSDQVYVGTTNPDGQANTVQLSVNGARSSQNTFTVDGSDITDRGSNLTIQAYPSVDSIGEFRVLRSLYPAESGRSGGGQVNVVTRSGTSAFHGNAFEFIRNEAFNANSFLNNAQTRPQFGRDENGKAKRPPFRYNNYGWTLGGPIYFLNFGERDPGDSFFKRYDKTFFFFSQEFRKDNRFAAANAVTVPDANLKAGIFPVDVCINRNNITTENCNSLYDPVLNPTGRRLAAGTPLPASLLNPAAAAYLRDIYSQIPGPNAPATLGNPYNASFSLPNIFKFRQEILKIDHSFSDKWQMYYRFESDKIPTVEGNALFASGSGLPGVSTTETNSPGKTHTFQSTYAFTSNMILELRYNYAYGAILSKNVGSLALTNTSIPVTLPFTNQRDRVPTLTGNGFTGLTSFGPYDNFSDKHNYTGSFTWILGNHTMKFGGIYSLYRKNENALAGNNEGIFNSFSSTTPTGLVLPTNGSISLTTAQNLQRWANFLVGNVAAGGFTQGSFDYTADLRQKTIEAYAQDEWRFRKNITLYYGVRYSMFGAPWDKNGRLTNFVPQLFDRSQAPTVNGSAQRLNGTGNNCNGLIVNAQNVIASTDPNCRPTISPYGKFVWDAEKNNFAPRVGIAWDPFGNGKTSIRSGYGMYHEQVLNGPLLTNIGTNPPYQINFTSPSVTRLDNPAGAIPGPPTVQSLRAFQTNFNTPYMQHWSLDVQRQVTSKTLVTIGYYGSKGTHLIGLTELNDLPVGLALNTPCVNAAGVTLTKCQPNGYVFRNTAAAPNNPNGTTVDILLLDQLRPYRGYRSIAMVQPRYNSNYHSLQVFGQHRFSGASQLNVAYTWSKNLTDSQNDRTTAPVDTYNIPAEYSRAALDRRHIFTLNYVYELPWFNKQNNLVGKVLGGWQASGIIVYNSGLGFTATTSNLDPGGTGIINANPAARPNLLCDPNASAPHTPERWFDTSCFQGNPPNTGPGSDTALSGFPLRPGNSQRNIIEGPATARVDFTLSKNIRFGESIRVQLRAEVFNIFNKTNFRGFSSLNVTSGAFGVIGSVRDPRTMQFGAKVYF